LWLHSLKVAQLLRSAACLHTNQSRSYLNHLVHECQCPTVTQFTLSLETDIIDKHNLPSSWFPDCLASVIFNWRVCNCGRLILMLAAFLCATMTNGNIRILTTTVPVNQTQNTYKQYAFHL